MYLLSLGIVYKYIFQIGRCTKYITKFTSRVMIASIKNGIETYYMSLEKFLVLLLYNKFGLI